MSIHDLKKKNKTQCGGSFGYLQMSKKNFRQK